MTESPPAEILQEFLNTVGPGEVRAGTVSGFDSFEAIVDLEGLTVLFHGVGRVLRHELSWSSSGVTARSRYGRSLGGRACTMSSIRSRISAGPQHGQSGTRQVAGAGIQRAQRAQVLSRVCRVPGLNCSRSSRTISYKTLCGRPLMVE